MASKLEGFKELEAFIKKLDPVTKKRLMRVLNAGGNAIQRQARLTLKANETNDQGDLSNSITSTSQFRPGTLAVEVGPTVKHGPFIEFGTKPHFPPQLPLKRWAERHGIEDPEQFARNLQLKIGWRGTEAQPYLIPAFNKIGPKIIKRLDQELRKF